MTARLLGERFELSEEGRLRTLLARRAEAEPPPLLLGKPTPYVGRDKELNLLDGTLRECVDESVARVVLVIGTAGQGKSRLRHEFVLRARQRPDVGILVARADPVGAGSSFLLVRQLVRQAVGLREGDSVSEAHARLRAHVAARCKAGDVARIADFLGELIAVPSTGAVSPQLLAARDEPRIMGEWLRRSFVEWLAAECAVRPLLVVLEDLHWGDLPSVTYLGEGLRELAAEPLMVLALARPEVKDVFRTLWPGAGTIEVPLSRLSARAAERVVRSALSDDVSAETVSRIVQRADGNAFYLEELVRRVSEGGGDALPETVLALVESRLQKIEPEARRIARAGSVFGEVFWRGAVAELTGGEDADDLDMWLASMVERELLTVRLEARFPGEREYAFRHGLLRDAAYAMLTDDDRRTAHGLAGSWLERAGEKDALALADHFEKGGDGERALPWVIRAAEAAYDGGSVAAARALAVRGIPHAAGEALGMLKAIEGTSAAAQGDMANALPGLREAVSLLPAGGRHWFLSTTSLAYFGALTGDPTATMRLAAALEALPREAARGSLYASAASRVVLAFFVVGESARAQLFLDSMEAARDLAGSDLGFAGSLALSRVYLNNYVPGGDLIELVSKARQAVALFEQLGDPVAIVNALYWRAVAALGIGRHDELEDAAARCIESARLSGNTFIVPHAECMLLASRLQTRDPASCVAPLKDLVSSPNPIWVAMGARVLSMAYRLSGDLPRAEATARQALEVATRAGHKGVEYSGHVALAEALLALGQPQACLDEVARVRALPVRNLVEVPVDLVAAEALMALGRQEEARSAIRVARARVLDVAARLDDAGRQAYLHVSFDARVIALARDWLGEGG